MGPKAIDLFVVAEQFRSAGRLAYLIPLYAADPAIQRLRMGDLPNMPAAASTCLAFSLELYFKCLIRISRKSFEREHDLVRLFNLIGKRNQAKIRRYFRQNFSDVRAYLQRIYQESRFPVPKADFDYVLSASKDAFVIMRYIYEGMPSDTGWLADDVLEGARKVILASHPEWERARQTGLPVDIIVRPTSQAH
jgi:hypothetical protein